MKNFIPATAEEIKTRGWNSVDIVLITPDAYVDHPSFAMAIIARVLEAEGYKTAILAQPDWRNPETFRKFGKPNLCFAISGGNMDSMINKYTHNRKIRSEDDFSPGGVPGKRPDRATVVYSNMAKMAYKEVPVIIGGIEATMRRFAHYDYWSDTVKRPLLLDSKADLLVYGMGEKTILDILSLLKAGKRPAEIRNLRGTAVKIGASYSASIPSGALVLPSYEEVSTNKIKFAEMTKTIYENLNPFCAAILAQKADNRTVLVNPPALPISTPEMDRIYDLPFLRKPHPSYKLPVPAFETIKNSLVIHRGCFGGCSFCSLGYHQGKFIQSRSSESVKKEAEKLILENRGSLTISDLGAPSANMYGMRGKDFSLCEKCLRESCLHPAICPNLETSHKELLELMGAVKELKGIKKIFIASGIRMDLALRDPVYLREIARNYTGGYLKVAPEHTEKEPLKGMRKPGPEIFLEFEKQFKAASAGAGKEQYLIPYFISAYPGTTLKDAVNMAVFLKKHGYRPLQINDFLPAPGEYATAVYYAELDPATLQKVYVPKKEGERKMHRALLQYFKTENAPLLAKALKITGDLNLLKFFLGKF